MSDDSASLSAKEFAASASPELHATQHDLTSRAAALMASAGLSLPTLPNSQTLQQAWKKAGLEELPRAERDQERHHCSQLERMINILNLYHPEVPCRKVFSCGDVMLGGEKNVKGAAKPDIVICDADVTEPALKEPGINDKIHLCVDSKSDSGAEFLTQCAKYCDKFGRCGAAFTFVLGLKVNRVTVMLFTPKGWAQCARFEYTDCSETVARWLYLLMSDKAIDKSFDQQVGRGLYLMGSQEAAAIYHHGLTRFANESMEPLRLSPTVLAKPLFKAPGLFGSRTKVWRVNTTCTSWDGAAVVNAPYLIKHSFVRKGRVPNDHYFLDEVKKLAENRSRAGHWFTETVGIWLSDNEDLQQHSPHVPQDAAIDPRVGVLHVMKPAAGKTWEEAWVACSVTDLLRSARDVIRVLWIMRPFHHRDISPNNLMINLEQAEDQDAEKLRMQRWLGWTGGQRAPGVVGSVIDLERGRWEDDPSDFQHRQARLQGRDRDPDESIDDAQTGTAPFLARAQSIARHVMLHAQPGQAADTVEWLKHNAHHRYWHDIESLLLCLLSCVYSRWKHSSPSIEAILKGWPDKGYVFGVTGKWLDRQAEDLDDCVRSQFDADPTVLEISGAIRAMFVTIKAAFIPSVGMDQSLLGNIKKAFAPIGSNAPFLRTLDAIIDTIPVVECAEEATWSPSSSPHASPGNKKRRV